MKTSTRDAYQAGRRTAREGRGLFCNGSQRYVRAFILGALRESRASTRTTACLACRGGRLTIEVCTIAGRYLERIRCIYCEGTGCMTPEQRKRKREGDAAWCRCGKMEPVYDGRYGAECRNCGGVVSTG